MKEKNLSASPGSQHLNNKSWEKNAEDEGN